jgi:hypothetical protein
MIFCFVLSTVSIIVGTWLGAPILSPIVVGFAAGLIRPVNAASRSAIAGALAWGMLLATSTLRGDAIGTFTATLGGAMGLPGFVIVVATLLYPAILASSAAWLGHLVSLRRFATFGPGTAPGTTPTNT